MYHQSDQTFFDFATPAPFQPDMPDSSAPLCVFERSVVSEAGFAQFACATGRSGHRYVFSLIQPDQMMSYDNAVFAKGEKDCGSVELFASTDKLAKCRLEGKAVYVHLIDADSADAQTIIEDLTV